jgi:hypothetical protein
MNPWDRNFKSAAERQVERDKENMGQPFAKKGLARRSEGSTYIPNDNGKQAVVRRKRQAERLAAKRARAGVVGDARNEVG